MKQKVKRVVRLERAELLEALGFQPPMWEIESLQMKDSAEERDIWSSAARGYPNEDRVV